MNNRERMASTILLVGGILLLVFSFGLLPENLAYGGSAFLGECSTTDCTSNHCIEGTDCGNPPKGSCPTSTSGCDACKCKSSGGGSCQCSI
jgi:hypothetical protein